jgi:ribosomal protein S18 acetylase RimI-like enzyme
MVTITYYQDSYYEQVKQILQNAQLYDEKWEARENLKRKIERDNESILIAITPISNPNTKITDQHQVVGCVFIVEDGWNSFIWRLCVKQNYRAKGIGTLLMQKAESIIKNRGITEVSLFVDPKNDELQNWYKTQNYIKASDWTFMYKKL